MNDNKQNPILWFVVLIVILLISKSSLLSRFKAEENATEEANVETVTEMSPAYQPLSEEVPSVEQAHTPLTPDEFIAFVQHMCNTLPYEGEVYEDYVARIGYDPNIISHDGFIANGQYDGEVGWSVRGFEQEMDRVSRFRCDKEWGSYVRCSIFVTDYTDAEYIYESLKPFMTANPLAVVNEEYPDTDSRENSIWHYSVYYHIGTIVTGHYMLEMERYDGEYSGYTIYVTYPFVLSK